MITYEHNSLRAPGVLPLNDLISNMVICGGIDPGNDESSDPDPFGWDPQPANPSKPLQTPVEDAEDLS